MTDQRELNIQGKLVPGRRVKHRMKSNWIKMYDKHPPAVYEVVRVPVDDEGRETEAL